MSGARSTKGCHTCRVRKKKCDEQHPVCFSCTSRGLVCYGYGPKPEWMDGGDREAEMTKGIRKMAERNYRERRKPWNKAKMGLESETGTASKGFEAANMVQEVTGGQVIRWDARESSPGRDVDRFSFPGGELPLLPSIYSPGQQKFQYNGLPVFQSSKSPVFTLPMQPLFWDSGLSTASPTQPTRSSYELGLLKHYLDIVFPLQFGFYKPQSSGQDNGLGWLFQLALSSNTLYHSFLSLGICHREQLRLGISNIDMPKRLAKNHAMSLKGLKESIDAMHERDLNGVELWDLAWELLACMNQLLSVEIFRDISGNWEMHLVAARTLLCMLSSKMNPSIPGRTHEDLLAHILKKTPSPHPSFFLTCFLWVDIISQASGLQPPHPPHLGYHFLLSPPADDPDGEPLLDLKNMMGCENWAMLVLLDIATLAAWKKSCLQTSPPTLNLIELHLRAAAIRHKLETGISNMLLQQKGLQPDSIDHDRKAVTHLFALSAFTYLAAVVHGTRPSQSTIRAAITRTLPVLATLPKRLIMRVSWPICVTGCMAVGKVEREVIRSLVSQRSARRQDNVPELMIKKEGGIDVGGEVGMGEGENSGTVWKGMRIVEECWRVHDADVDKGLEEREFGWEEGMAALGLRILLV